MPSDATPKAESQQPQRFLEFDLLPVFLSALRHLPPKLNLSGADPGFDSVASVATLPHPQQLCRASATSYRSAVFGRRLSVTKVATSDEFVYC
jgi:hypothetical protein